MEKLTNNRNIENFQHVDSMEYQIEKLSLAHYSSVLCVTIRSALTPLMAVRFESIFSVENFRGRSFKRVTKILSRTISRVPPSFHPPSMLPCMQISFQVAREGGKVEINFSPA